jgi:TPR repeat protein
LKLGIPLRGEHAARDCGAQGVFLFPKIVEQSIRVLMRMLCCLLLLACIACNKKPQTKFGQLKELADDGDVTAQFKVGNSYYLRNSKREHKLALEYLEMAAENGHMEAQFLAGFMYDIGEGRVGRDNKKAGKYFSRAAAQGHAEAQQLMILRTQYGDGVPKSAAKAFMWAVLATANGDPRQGGISAGWKPSCRQQWLRMGTEWLKSLSRSASQLGNRRIDVNSFTVSPRQ